MPIDPSRLSPESCNRPVTVSSILDMAVTSLYPTSTHWSMIVKRAPYGVAAGGRLWVAFPPLLSDCILNQFGQ